MKGRKEDVTVCMVIARYISLLPIQFVLMLPDHVYQVQNGTVEFCTQIVKALVYLTFISWTNSMKL